VVKVYHIQNNKYKTSTNTSLTGIFDDRMQQSFTRICKRHSCLLMSVTKPA
jgi:hypothetical protein